MESIREKMLAMEAKLKENEQELVALHSACDDYKAENEALKVSAEEVKADFEAKAEEMAEAQASFESNLQEKDEDIAILVGEVDELKAKVELTPELQDVAEGQEPVAEGAPAVDEVIDHEVELSKLASSAERIAYFRAHIENK